MLAGLDAIGGFVIGGATGGSFTVSVDPETVTKSAAGHTSSKTLTTSPVTVTAEGGAGGYTYSWARVSGDTSITATASTAAVTSFTATVLLGTTVTADFVCTVTDAAGAHLATNHVTVTMTLVEIEL